MSPRRRNEAGAAFLEFAISAGVFFMMLILTADVMRFSLDMVKAQFIVNRAIRDLVLAQHDLAGAKTAIVNHAARFGETVDAAHVRVCAGQALVAAALAAPPPVTLGDCSNYDPCAGAAQGPGGGRDILTIHLCYSFNFTLWNWELPVTASAVARNEPF